MFEILFTEEATKQLSKLETGQQKRIISVLERARVRPFSHVKRLVGSPYFRIRAGDYRIIVDVLNDKLIIMVIKAGHRKDVYD